MENNQNQGNNSQNNNQNSPRRQNIILLVVAAVITLLFMSTFLRAFSDSTSEELTYSEFLQMADKGEIEKIEIQDDRIVIYPVGYEDQQHGYGYQFITGKSSKTYFTGKAEFDSDLTERMLELGIVVTSEVPDNSGLIITFLLTYIVPIALMWLVLSFIFKKMGKGGGPLSVGRSTAKVYVQKETGVTFKDVAGEDEAKESLVEVVDFLHNPGKYAKIGAKLPKGALLVGPPGTGKTLLAKAVAGEAHVPFYSLAGSDFIELYVGVGASRVRDLFNEANKNAPCIIFIDEIDAIGRSRDSKYGGGNEEREQTLNQLLSEMDGFDSSKGVLVLGATNRPEILDKALLRPGRFDRRITVDKPDLKGREEILKVHSKDVKMDETVNLKEVALATSGAVGSDLANMINEAAIIAVKDNREYVSQKDLLEAVEQVELGKEKKDRILSKEERKIVAYHEVGHAIVTAVLKNTEPVQKITIVPRTRGTLGYVLQVPEDENHLQTKEELMDELYTLLAGRAAEEVIFNTVTTGAFNDIERATSIARSMITLYGMSEKFGLIQLESIQNRYLDANRTLNCSYETETLIDQEVKKLLDECYAKSKEIVRAHLDTMDKIAQFLIERETITGKEFMDIYRASENIPEPTEEEKEAAKAKRIYATRPESAVVGENVPVKGKDDNKSSFDAQVSDAGVQNGPAQGEGVAPQNNDAPQNPVNDNNNNTPDNQGGINWGNTGSQQNQGGGRFSHVPEDFDKQ
ncbi:ATP-dependent zinc metalloprotease FtsH [Butyrivibrio proteoclasticus]|uniref:ATP-dependent zinc metalloprotease FtsH n=1 Tax=Butyrivibrio proteoclasticus TaxID=43305 RepID=UPI0009DCEE2D|nr:ATP-dependent zinc metalloprotease FtsH [Butyrivibrio proteoclasticus]